MAQFNTNNIDEISNLITDMTLKGASESEIERAVKHSMAVIDSERENGIKELKTKYMTN